MILNNVTKFHKILIKNIWVREQTSFKTVNFHKQRATTTESMAWYGPLSNLKEDIMVLNNVTRFHKILKRMRKIYPKMTELEWSQYFSHYKSMGIFPDTQGQLTHKSQVRSCRISDPSKMLWLSSLFARIKKNQWKMKELEWSQGFPHYNPMGAICCHGNQSSDPIWPKT